MIPAPVRVAALAAILSAPAWAQETPPTTDPADVERLQSEMARLQTEMDALRSELRAKADAMKQEGIPGGDEDEGAEDEENADTDARDAVAPIAPIPPIPPVPGAEAMPPMPPMPPIPPGPVEDRVAYGHAVHVYPGETVNDVASFGGAVIVEGHVLGDVASFGGPIDLRPGAVVEGDAQSFGGMVYVADGAELHGDRINFAGSDSFSGDDEDQDVHAPSLLRRAYNKLVFLLSLAGAGVLVVGLFPKRVAKVAENIGEQPIRSAVVGTLGSIVLSAVGVLFAITIIGLPLSFVLFGLLGIAWLLGFVALCQAIGDRLPFEQKPHGRWIAFLGGVLLVSFVGALPFVGWVAVLGISVVGVGAALSTRFGIA